MPRFAVRYLAGAGGPAGRTLRDAVIEAADAAGVPAVLSVRPADVLTVQPLDAGAGRVSGARFSLARLAASRPQKFPLRLFSQELAVLLDAGIPLLESLAALREKESGGETAQVLDEIIQRLEQGQSFGAALRERPETFGPLFTASIEASQGTGQIPQALRRHADYLSWIEGLRDKLVGALIYPAILVGVGSLVMLFLITFVIPRFAQIYDDLGNDLPLLSRLLLDFGRFINTHWMWLIAGLAAALLALAAAWRSPAVRARLAAWLWTLPYVGERMRLVELSALYRTLGMLLQAGVTAVPALQACSQLVSPSLRLSLQAATRGVREGLRLSDSLERQQLGTPVSLRMMRVGERSGELGAMLERAAAFYDEELARFTDFIGRVISPALMLVMGLMIGVMVVLMYLPIFQVADQIQ